MHTVVCKIFIYLSSYFGSIFILMVTRQNIAAKMIIHTMKIGGNEVRILKNQLSTKIGLPLPLLFLHDRDSPKKIKDDNTTYKNTKNYMK